MKPKQILKYIEIKTREQVKEDIWRHRVAQGIELYAQTVTEGNVGFGTTYLEAVERVGNKAVRQEERTPEEIIDSIKSKLNQ